MKKFIVVFIVLCFMVGMLPLQGSAADTIANINWQISSLTDMDNNSVTVSRPILSLDVDMGMSYFNVYGILCSMDGANCMATSGGGYLDQDPSDGSISVIMDLQIGSKTYRLKVALDTLSGTCAIYDHTGDIEAVGSIDLMGMNAK